MMKGRRTRNSGKVSAKPFPDTSSSPRRKDMKFDAKDSAEQQMLHGNVLSQTSGECMKLRGGRMKIIEISQFLQPTHSASTATLDANPPSKAKYTIDSTDENTCDSFDTQSSNLNDCLTAIGKTNDQNIALVETRKFNNQKNNNNIFLQDPVPNFNFNDVPTTKNRSSMKLHNAFVTDVEIKRDLFTLNSQPKIKSLWKAVTMTPAITCLKEQQEDSTACLDPHILDLSKPTQVTQIDSTTTAVADKFLNLEESSCDSGDSGIILSGTDGAAISSSSVISQLELSVTENQTDISEKRKKPTTPHRILCPSPVKNAIIYLQNPQKLSYLDGNPNNRGINKSRKRLNVKDAKHIPTTGQAVQDDASKPQLQNVSQRNEAVNPSANVKIDAQTRPFPVPTSSKQSTGGSKKITEFYPIRRSVRKTKKEVQVERDRDIERAIREGKEEGLKVVHFEGKGRGIVTTRPFTKGEFVVEYVGDLISVSEAKQREQLYAKDDNTGCYMYYFRHKNLQHCIDATAESGRFGRLVNHSRNGNLITKTVTLNNRPHLVLIAKEDIYEGVEVTYDYGDRSKEALQHHPWLAL